MSEPLRCAHCTEVIGVYEPLVAVAGGQARETSLAAEAVRADGHADCYHRACYDDYRHSRPFGERPRETSPIEST